MNNFEVSKGQTLKVNILTDGPTIAANYKDQGGEDLNDIYIKSGAARAQLMQKLMGDKDMGNLRPAEPKVVEVQPVSLTQMHPSNCVVFSNMFDPKKVDLKKEPSFYIDMKDQVKLVCADFGKVS